MALTYTVGDSPVETATFKVGGVLTDPTTVTATVISPSGVSSNPTPAHPSTGTYTVTFDATEAGDWFIRIAGTGAAKGAKETYVTVRRSEVPGSNLIAEALVTVADMRFFLDRVGQTADMDETRWLEDLINSYSLACVEFCNGRQFTPERTPAAGKWPLQSDPLATAVTKRFSYEGNGYMSLGPYEPRTVTAVVVGIDLPTASQVTLNNGSGTVEAEYRLEPAAKTPLSTYLWMALPPRDASLISGVWRTTILLPSSVARQVAVTGDWGAPAGLVPASVAHACKIAVGQAFRNPEDYIRRSEAGLDIDEGTPSTPGSLPVESRMLLNPWRRP